MLQIWWLVEHNWVIVVTFDWRITASDSAAAAAAAQGTSPGTQARLLGHFDLMMKLNHKPATGGNMDFDGLLDRHYTAGAWEPKHFKITIEQGIFRGPMRAGGEVEDLRRASGTESRSTGSSRSWDWAGWFVPEKEDPAEQYRYAYRLFFDKSPYPPIEDWVHPYHPRIGGSDPETKIEFVAQLLPKSEWGKPAMNQAWQREMVRVWESRPLSEPFVQMEMQSKESALRGGERRLKRRAKIQAELEEARKQAEAHETDDLSKTEAAKSRKTDLEE